MSKKDHEREEWILRFKKEELALKVAKEIVVKFIEVGKVTPSSFQEAFKAIHSEVKRGLGLDAR